MKPLIRALGTLGLLASAASGVWGAEASFEQALERYREVRPSEKELALYQLDWVPDLEEAMRRARAEDRPVLLVRVFAQYGEMISGHC